MMHVQLGQWASSRTDLFPPYVCEILAKLQSHVSPHSFEATRRVIKKEYGISLEDMFEEFDPKPIGVGAIAQVLSSFWKEKTTLWAYSTDNSIRCIKLNSALHPLFPLLTQDDVQ